MDDPRLSIPSAEHFDALVQILPNLLHLSLCVWPRKASLPVSVFKAAAHACQRLAFLEINGINMDPSKWACIPLAPSAKDLKPWYSDKDESHKKMDDDKR